MSRSASTHEAHLCWPALPPARPVPRLPADPPASATPGTPEAAVAPAARWACQRQTAAVPRPWQRLLRSQRHWSSPGHGRRCSPLVLRQRKSERAHLYHVHTAVTTHVSMDQRSAACRLAGCQARCWGAGSQLLLRRLRHQSCTLQPTARLQGTRAQFPAAHGTRRLRSAGRSLRAPAPLESDQSASLDRRLLSGPLRCWTRPLLCLRPQMASRCSSVGAAQPPRRQTLRRKNSKACTSRQRRPLRCTVAAAATAAVRTRRD